MEVVDIIIAFGVVLLVLAPFVPIIAVLSWDGERPCEPGCADCESCPFPPCEKRKSPNSCQD